jgi:hypothetical protein
LLEPTTGESLVAGVGAMWLVLEGPALVDGSNYYQSLQPLVNEVCK